MTLSARYAPIVKEVLPHTLQVSILVAFRMLTLFGLIVSSRSGTILNWKTPLQVSGGGVARSTIHLLLPGPDPAKE